MYELDQQYLSKLEELASEIQASEELAAYLESEEDEDYYRLKESFEPRIAIVYNEVAKNNPLQLIPFELVLLESYFEGLFLPKILGYSVLRGEINDRVKYARPHDHFKEVLLAICNSANFDILKKRIGQTIQIGFALSSDIWVTNLINGMTNKRVRYYLQAQKLDKYRIPDERLRGMNRYRRQFKNDNFMTAEFPSNLSELKVFTPSLKTFLIYRINLKEDNSSLLQPIKDMLTNKEFHNTPEHLHVLMLYAYFFERSEEDDTWLKEVLHTIRTEMPEFGEHFMNYYLSLHDRKDLDIIPEADVRFSALLDESVEDDIKGLYGVADVIHDKGYLNEEVHDAIKTFYISHEGVSTVNECIRQIIYHYFKRLVTNLDVKSYADFFEISRYFSIYMKIFDNQRFNQDLKEMSMAYVRKLLKIYTDKRGKDYQDIKKFVSTTFLDFEFLTEKEITELFKTRRKRKKTES